MELLLTQRALSNIVKECVSHHLTETGGILIGKKIESAFIVPFAICSGPRAARCCARFAPDSEWQQRILDKLFCAYSVNYVGSFHRHPGFSCWPSSLDYKTAKEITSSRDWNVREAVFPIVIFNKKGIEIHPYYLSRNSNSFQPIDWKIISNDSELAKAFLKRRIE